MPLKIELSTVMLHYWQSQPSQGDWIVLHSMTRCTSLLYDTSGFDQGAMCTVHCALCTVQWSRLALAGQAPLSYPAALHPFHLKEMLITPTIAPIKAANRISSCRQTLALLYLCDLPFCTCLTTCTNCTYQVLIYLFKAPLFCNMCKTFPFQCFQRNTSTNHHFCLLSVCVWEALDLLELHNTLSNCQKPSWNRWLSDGGSFSYHTVRTTFAAGYFEVEK